MKKIGFIILSLFLPCLAMAGKIVTPVRGPIHLYHGLSNFNPTLGQNLSLLEVILGSSGLFPKGTLSRDPSLEHAVFQAMLPQLEEEEVVEIALDDFIRDYPDLSEKILADSCYREQFTFSSRIRVDATYSGMLRTHANYFYSGKFPDGYYNKFLTLHYELSEADLSELSRDTFGSSVLYSFRSEIIMPQVLPNQYLTSVIINDNSSELKGVNREFLRDEVDHVIESANLGKSVKVIFASELSGQEQHESAAHKSTAPYTRSDLLSRGTFQIGREIVSLMIRANGISDHPEYHGIRFIISGIQSGIYTITAIEEK